jgi:DNA-binding IclR family transcriptional regulator
VVGRTVPGKLLGVLDAFSHERNASRLSELARRTGLPLSTAHRLVGELVRWGRLERGEDGRYRVGLRLVEIAALCPRGIGLRDVALPFIEDLYEATHQNVQLAVGLVLLAHAPADLQRRCSPRRCGRSRRSR